MSVCLSVYVYVGVYSACLLCMVWVHVCCVHVLVGGSYNNCAICISVICWQCNLNTEEITYAPGKSLRVTVKPRDTEWTSFCSSLCAQQTEPFHLVDLGQVLHSHQLWQENMPHIRPYYGEDYAACLM